jgi:predicted amidophosphoribosyltransferase
MYDLSSLPTPPTGFGRCASCPYYETGPAGLCFACARQTIESLAKTRCGICDLPYTGDEQKCGNPICNFDNIYFRWNYSVAMKSGYLDSAIKRYKYADRKSWAVIFARVLVGFLNEEHDLFKDFDLIVANPTYVTRDGVSRTRDHTRRVIQEAYSQCHGSWPFDVGDGHEPAIIKITATTKMTKSASWKERHEIATGELRDSLRVPDPKRIKGQSILVYDDVFTDGHTLNEVARRLKFDGADDVCGVSLARQPWGRS